MLFGLKRVRVFYALLPVVSNKLASRFVTMPVIDPRLKRQLDGSGLVYEVSSHYLRGVLGFTNGRSQVFLIDPTTDSVGDHEDHDILSPIADLVTYEVRVRSKAYELLKFAGTQRLGQMSIVGTTLVYKADCSVDCSPEAFRSVVETVCLLADKLEKALTKGADNF